MSKIHTLKLNFSRFAILCAALALVGSTPAAADQDPFAGSTPIDLNATLRGRGGAGETRMLRLDVPAAGIVSVDLSVPGGARAAPRIALAGAAESRAVLIEHSAGRLSFAVRTPGTYYLRAGAQDPRQALGDFKVRTAFVDAEALDQELSDLIASKTAVIEVDPDPLTSPIGDKTAVIEVDPDPLTSPVDPVGDRIALVGAHCRGGEMDDHGDVLPCATLLRAGQEAAGEIDNDLGDDADVFALVLESLETVRLETTGDADTFGALYDRFGQRLALDDDGGRGVNFRIVRTLSPGLYFLKVEGGRGAEGSYRLAMAILEW